ncbi:replication factor A protein 3 [Athelia psychrophila]|uniref:Replication factor A protein 3 n=1 Tax=Athelia psychrophila TaxID=1759441 RepID=A0A166NH60_9AGAM|nr:replication factor A protein 3 [Fibularhizoctonia sp. CBS 109695]
MADYISVRVTSAQLPKFVGQKVRLVGKTIKIQGESAIVEASDGGQVEVKMTTGVKFEGVFNEIMGTVQDERTIKLVIAVDLGPDLDMKLVNDVVMLTHDPRWRDRMFRQ